VATAHIPFFITAPGQTDTILAAVTIFVIAAVVLAGIFFLTLHTLPERIAHRSRKVQFDIVAILGLIALFTNEHIYWIIGLLLAFIEIPDFGSPVQRMVAAVEKIAATRSGPAPAVTQSAADQPAEPAPLAESKPVEAKSKGAVHA
jgi:hypothetical protein